METEIKGIKRTIKPWYKPRSGEMIGTVTFALPELAQFVEFESVMIDLKITSVEKKKDVSRQ